MKTIIFIFIAMSFAVISHSQTYKVDAEKSVLSWLGEKVTGEHTGTISIKSGEFVIKDSKLVSGKFEIDMNSIVNTDITDEGTNKNLVNHLKSADFFDVAKYPVSVFELTSPVSFVGGSGLVKGNLTIKGKKEKVEFKATMVPTSSDIKFFGVVIVDRSKYDIKYGSGSFFDNLGDKTIYDEFKIKLNIVSVEKK